VLGYKYDEIGLVAGAIVGTVVGYGTLKKMLRDRLKPINQNEM
jgi:ADP-ribosylglycohydrolase